MHGAGEITRLLGQLDDERPVVHSAALEQLIPLIYGQLKELARANRYRWRGYGTPGTTSLVHEAYIKLTAKDQPGYTNRRQFYSIASKAMRNILIDNARWNGRLKRGEGHPPLPLDEAMLVSAERSEELLALDEALAHLEELESRLARIVECRCFAGLTIDETAETLAISPATVKRGWTLARTWLYRELRSTPE